MLDNCLALCVPLGNEEHLARTYGYLAEVTLWEGELDQAAAWLRQSFAH